MATPYVTNIAAKIKAINPSLSPTEIINIMGRSVTKTQELKDKTRFGGVVNERGALELAVKSLPGLSNCSLEVIDEKISSIKAPEEPILKKTH
jgi:hypothetical protein